MESPALFEATVVIHKPVYCMFEELWTDCGALGIKMQLFLEPDFPNLQFVTLYFTSLVNIYKSCSQPEPAHMFPIDGGEPHTHTHT